MQEINQNFPNLVSSLSRMQVLFCGFSFLINLVTVLFFLMKLKTNNCDYHKHWHSSRFTMGPYWWNCGPMLLLDLCRWMRQSKMRLFQINRCYHRARIWWLSMELSSIWKLLIFSRKASLFLLDFFISMKENVQDSVFSHYAWGWWWACFFRLIDLVQGELSLASSIISLKVTISSCIVGFVSSPGWQFDTWISFPNEEVLKGWVWWGWGCRFRNVLWDSFYSSLSHQSRAELGWTSDPQNTSTTWTTLKRTKNTNGGVPIWTRSVICACHTHNKHVFCCACVIKDPSFQGVLFLGNSVYCQLG